MVALRTSERGRVAGARSAVSELTSLQAGEGQSVITQPLPSTSLKSAHWSLKGWRLHPSHLWKASPHGCSGCFRRALGLR